MLALGSNLNRPRLNEMQEFKAPNGLEPSPWNSGLFLASKAQFTTEGS